MISQDTVDGISGGAGLGSDQMPLFPEQAIRNRGLSGIRPSHHRDVNGRFRFGRIIGGQPLDHLVKQVAAALPHCRTDSLGLAKPQRVEAVLLGTVLQIVQLVHH